ncbi:MAG TPA: hypothetical protein VIG44_10595 [Thermomicrobiales bacterium]
MVEMMIYELWYDDTGNIIDAYKAETDALAEVRAFIEDYGPSSVSTMILLAAPEGSEKEVIAHGPQLVERAMTAIPASSQTAAT